MGKMLRDGRKKASVADPAFPGVTVAPQLPHPGSDTTTSQGKCLYLQAHSKPEHTVAVCSPIRNTGMSQGLDYFPSQVTTYPTEYKTLSLTPEQHQAHSSRAKYPHEEGGNLCQTIHTTNLQTAFSNTCGNKEELIPDYKLILQVAQSNWENRLVLYIQILPSYQLKNYIQKAFWVTWEVSTTKSERSVFAETKTVDT